MTGAMKILLAVAIVAPLAGATPALAQSGDLLSANSIACTPERVTDCESADKCTSRDATARDKQDLLVIDFAAREAFVRNAGKRSDVGPVIEDRIVGGVRRFGIRDGSQVTQMSLAADGALTLTLVEEGGRQYIAHARCTAGS
jgi:hypothetical protein